MFIELGHPQVVRELKRTGYRPKMAILVRPALTLDKLMASNFPLVHVSTCCAFQASREHYCVHPTVSKKANKDEECQNMLKDDSSCKFFKNVAKLYSMQTSHFLQV